MLPEAHTFHVLEETMEVESALELETSTELMLALPFVVHVSKVRDLIMDKEDKYIINTIHYTYNIATN